MAFVRGGGLTWVFLGVLLVGANGYSAPPAVPEPRPEQLLYWWHDEIRTVAHAVSIARTGSAAQWPRMSVAAGSAVLPLPRAATAIQLDGRLGEPAWQQATTFPVGPVFDDWRSGPFSIQVSVCRDEKQMYLAIQSPRDLTGLGSLSAGGELFCVDGEAFCVGRDARVPPESVHGDGQRQVIELALPLNAEPRLVFAVEALRRPEGKLPLGADLLGLDKPRPSPPARQPAAGRQAALASALDDPALPLWLQPITVRLIPAEVAVQLTWSDEKRDHRVLESRVIAADQPPVIGQTPLDFTADASVLPYAWQAASAGKPWSLDGFVYREPVGGTSAWDAAARTAWRESFCLARQRRARSQLSLLDAPLLFVKQHPYFAGHIYDDFYPWHPGGGIYVLEDAQDPRPDRRVRPVIAPTTNETLGEGVYRDPELFWDASKLVFAHKGQPQGVTSLYEIGIDGRGLKRLTASDTFSDYQPAYLPDGRIVFISTRPRALVPCFNSGVGTLHTINPDGSGLCSISVNNVNEFDPSIMHDGRILYGRWEYVDKTALYMQSLWTMQPDGRMEEALFANNLAKPTALLDARAVPGSSQVVASLTPHNGQAVGAIGMVDTVRGKNDTGAVFNFTPEYPVEMDQGLRVGPCDPWPLSETGVLISNNAIGEHGIIELVDRAGNRELVHAEPGISCYAPMLVKPRPRPPVAEPATKPQEPGRFLLVDVYQGLTGIPRGTVKRLRIVEETARTSGLPPGGRWWNQAFLISWQGGYVVKNLLGTVPVHEDGSAYFEAPPGRAIYFEALDAEGRELQRMRTFVQAAPGVTRSCVGCHEYKKSTPPAPAFQPAALRTEPAQVEPESWGSGYIDYPSMVQPVLDKYCVRCHGGPEGFGKGLDFSGGWTWAFNIGYETLIKHRLTGFLNCNNGSVHTSLILPPRTIGSGAAPLAEILVKKHPEISRAERDLVLAWMDTNSNYYGSWDYTPYATCDAIMSVKGPLNAVMRQAGCAECHAAGHIGNDWVNLQNPEWSRILRAPMPKAAGSLGAALCRKRKAGVGYPLVNQSVQPPDVMLPSRQPPWDPGGETHATLTTTDDPHYRAMLQIIRQARAEALSRPRIDMPGAEIVPGECRMRVSVPVPQSAPALTAAVRADAAVELAWPRTAETIGLQYELHRGPQPQFTLDAASQIGLTTAGRFVDLTPPVGRQHYALAVSSGSQRSPPVWVSLDVPTPPSPAAPTNLAARPLPGEVALTWESPSLPGTRYDVYRAPAGSTDFAKLTGEPLQRLSYSDLAAASGTSYLYAVRAIDRRGLASPLSAPVAASPLPEIKEPVFVTDFTRAAEGRRLDGTTVKGELHGAAKVAGGSLILEAGGFATFPHQSEFDLGKALSVECWLWIDRESPMPVIISAGAFNRNGWFLQRFGGGWRWHVAPDSCDGGRPAISRWLHLAATYSDTQARLYQDGKLVAETVCDPHPAPWNGPLVIGQYSTQADNYQVLGKITGVAVYRRVLRPEEIARHFTDPPAK